MRVRMTIFYNGRPERIDLYGSKKQIKKFIELARENRSALALESVCGNHLTLGGFNKDFKVEIKDAQSFGARVEDTNTIVAIEQLSDDAQKRSQCCVKLH